MANDTLTIHRDDLSSLMRGKYVTYTGRLASMGHDDFVEIVEAHGGRYGPGAEVSRLSEVNSAYRWHHPFTTAARVRPLGRSGGMG